MPIAPSLTVTYFTAPWCLPCKQLLPKVRSIVEKVGGLLHVVDIDQQPDRALRADIRAVPTVVIETGPERAVLAGDMATPIAVRNHLRRHFEIA